MTGTQREILKDWISLVYYISKDEFLELKDKLLDELNIKEYEFECYLLELAENIYEEKNSEYVELILTTLVRLDLFTETFVDIFSKLLEVDWHYSHEYIARLFQKLKSPKSVNALYKASTAYYEYLDGITISLKNYCVHALGDIGTKEAKEKLKLLENEIDDTIIVEKIKRQLKRF